MKKLGLLSLVLLLFIACKEKSTPPEKSIISIEDYGIKPDSKENASKAVGELIRDLQKREDTTSVTVIFPTGRYDFFEEDAFTKEYYISNHDQDNPKKVGFALENLKNVTLDGQGSDFIFHGRMVPIAILEGSRITLKNMAIDFELPAFRQLEVMEVDKANNEVMVQIYPPDNYRIDDGKLVVLMEGHELTPNTSMGFRADKRLTYRRGDIEFNPEKVEEIEPGKLRLTGWGQVDHTKTGERFALRTYYRPTPGIFVSNSKDTELKEVTVHYAEGMGLLVQLSENITLDGFSVALRGEDDPRYFTTQADATHFSSVKGKIISKNGLYEGMADDAINVHGTYLRITKRIDNHTLEAQYMHPQAWGFQWGNEGDEVQFIESERMELIDDSMNRLTKIEPADTETIKGAKKYRLHFEKELPEIISEEGKFAVENLTWTPEVAFTNNIIRNNRARGTLFSTPRRVLVENNLFDHTHGAAILLAGDANGWFETGPSHDVTIRKNRFINALTANYQFTNAIISIYPEIPDLEHQEKFYHSNVTIEDNYFDTFDTPILYAKSVDGIKFINNEIKHNNEFEPFHWNHYVFNFEKVKNVEIKGNKFERDFDPQKDISIKLSPGDALDVEE